MNLNQLKLFHLAVKRKNLGLAARELNITQPAVSKGIQRLQDYYEVKLARRVGKRLELTRAGEALFGIAEKVFQLEKLADDCMREHQEEGLKRIRIDASESFGGYYLPAFINRFNRSNPKIQVEVEIFPDHRVVENTLNLENDVGFTSLPVKNRKLRAREVLEDELVIISTPDNPLAKKEKIAPRDLEGRTMIMHERGSIFQRVIGDLMEKEGVSMAMPMTLSNNEAIKRAVEGGAGIAMISRKAAEKEIESGKLAAISLADRAISRKFYMIIHKEKHVSPSLQSLIDLLLPRVDMENVSL
ncbi:MAG: LysR family transcriptional regulator [Desulfobacterales bacterium]|nr:LysR family transcriptional regulator [Desulfobacterales bacterium]